MDISTITQLISSVGFPIFCCVYFMWYNQTVLDNLKTSIEESNNKTDEVINNLTLTIQKLIDNLDKGES